MNKYLKTCVSVELAVVFTCLFTVTSWASLFEFNPDFYEVDAHYIYEASIQGGEDRYFCVGSCGISVGGWISVPEGDYNAFRFGETDWTWSYELTDTGLSLYSTMSIYTFYEYDPEQPDFADVGDVYMYSVGNWVSFMALEIPPTDQLPVGTVIPFAIQAETWGDPWESCEWNISIAGMSVNQDNYDQAIFNLEVGKNYSFYLSIPAYGMETQKIEDGYLESCLDIHFSRVPIPGAVWLLGSGLVGLIGLKRKYFK